VQVVDFQSLYPSLIIAYNLCYSTLAGKLDYHSTRPEMRVRGRSTNRLGPFKYSERRSATVLTHHMKSLRSISSGDDGSDRAYVFPTGSIFVSESVLKGVLPQVLDEMLATRSMLKKVAKDYRRRFHEVSPAVLRQLEARQLALKYVANVTCTFPCLSHSCTFAESTHILPLFLAQMDIPPQHSQEDALCRYWQTLLSNVVEER
jgi:DNA polymerase zeta